MKKVQGTAGVKLIECVSPAKNKWRIRFDVQPADDGSATYCEWEFNHRPSDEEVRTAVTQWCNGQTDAEILSGFSYDGVQVWLSSENQFNYKAAYDLAVQSDGATLPVTFKFGSDAEPVYRTFDTLDELRDFYTAAMAHIQSALENGWRKKDSLNLEDYRA